jgi:spore maturation protein CgeB
MNKRVLVVGPFGPGQLPESFARAFERLGWETFRFDSDRAYFEAGPGARNRLTRRALRGLLWGQLNRTVLELVRCLSPRLVLTVKGTFLHAETLDRIRGLNAPVVNYYADNPYCGVPLNPRKSSTQRRDLISVLRRYDRVWIWERSMAKRLQDDGVVAAYLPFGVDPESTRGQGGACEECGVRHDVVFIGQHSDKRENHLAAIQNHSVALWGSRWATAARRFKGLHVVHSRPAFASTCSTLYRSALVSLNIVDDLNMPGHNMRTWEIPASGGVMLSTYTAEQAELFPEGEAALYYQTPDQLDAIITEAKGDPARIEAVRRRGAEISGRNHYDVRIRAVLEDLGCL